MGIHNPLRSLKPFICSVHIEKYAGKRVGIDAYSWLHKGGSSVLACQATGRSGISITSCTISLSFALYDHAGRTTGWWKHPLQVCHGRRETNLELAKEKLKEGNSASAIEFFRKAVQITPMAHNLVQILRSESVEFIVAPYEADA